MGEPIRVIVCGGRAFDDRTEVDAVMDRLNRACPIGEVHVGSRRGADGLAVDWAHYFGAARGLPRYMIHEARWSDFGRSAGPRRNAEMLVKVKPHAVVAFRGGRGTDDMVRRSLDAGVSVFAPEFILQQPSDAIRRALAMEQHLAERDPAIGTSRWERDKCDEIRSIERRLRELERDAEAAECERSRILSLVRSTRMPKHGICQPRERKACTICNANDALDEILREWGGGRIRTAAACRAALEGRPS